MYDNIACIASKDISLLFKSFGIASFVGGDDIDKLFFDIVDSKKYGVIFISEDVAESLDARISDIREEYLPVIIIIPDKTGSTKFSEKILIENMERAIGTDALLKREGD